MPGLMVPGDVRIRTDKRLDEFETPFADVMGAAFEQAYRENPLQALGRMSDLGEERFGATEVLPAPATSGLMPGDPAFGEPTKPRPRTPLVSAEDARARIKEEGVKLEVPDSGIPHGALQILIDRKRAEMKRADAIQRSSGDILTQGARFGTALAASVLDPVNVGLAFVPAVGPTRYALMVERAGGAFGRAGVRAGVGAVEGAAGAAIVEPVIYAAGRTEQADYDLTDSLLNIAFGTAFGGGLHVGGGAVADAVNWRTARAKDGLARALAEASPETREAALRTAVSQVVEGRQVSVDGLLGMDARSLERLTNRQVLTEQIEAVRAFDAERAPRSVTEADLDRLQIDRDRAIYADVLEAVRIVRDEGAKLERDRPPSLATFLVQAGGVRDENVLSLGGDIRAIMGTTRARPGLVNNQSGLDPDEAAMRAWQKGYLRNRRDGEERPTPDDLFEAIRAELAGRPEYPNDYASAARRIDETSRWLDEMDLTWRGQTDESVVSQLRELLPRDDDLLAVRGLSDIDAERAAMESAGSAPGLAMRRAQDAAVRAQQPDSITSADLPAAAAADEKFAQAPKLDAPVAPETVLAEVMEDIDALAAQFGDDVAKSVKAELAEYDSLAEMAETMGRAARAAASCGLRKGL